MSYIVILLSGIVVFLICISVAVYGWAKRYAEKLGSALGKLIVSDDQLKLAQAKLTELESKEGQVLLLEEKLNHLTQIAGNTKRDSDGWSAEGWSEIAFYYAQKSQLPLTHKEKSRDQFLRSMLGDAERKASDLERQLIDAQQEKREFAAAFEEFARAAWGEDADGKKFGEMLKWIEEHHRGDAEDSPKSVDA